MFAYKYTFITIINNKHTNMSFYIHWSYCFTFMWYEGARG